MVENFLTNLPSKIDPVAFSLSSIDVRWYSLGYLVAFAVFAGLVFYRIRKGESPKKSTYQSTLSGTLPKERPEETFWDILIFAILGLLLGGRIGFGLFYNFELITQPWLLFYPFSGGQYVGIYGMSFFGGLLGALLSVYAYCRIKKINFGAWLNFLIPAVGLAYFFGRVGNFLNGELYGRETDLPWGMIFPGDPSGLVRHPSQLYEAFFEGLMMFTILWPLRNNEKVKKKLFALFLILYGTFRFLIEFVREEQFYGIFTTGQWLSLGIIAVGVIIIISPFSKGD